MLSYGTVTPITVFTPFEVSKTKKKSQYLSLIRILTIIVEVGISFTGVGVLGEVGVGLVAGAINQALDASQGTTSLFGTLINFGTPFIAGAAVAKSNLKGVSRLYKNSKKIGTALSGVSDASKITPELARKIAFLESQGLIESTTSLAEVKALYNLSIKINQASKFGTTGITKLSAADKGARGITKKITQEFSNQAITSGQSAANAIKNIRVKEIINKLSSISDKIFQESFEQLDELKILKQIGFSIPESNRIIKILSDANLTSEQRYSAVLGYIRNINVLTDRRADFKSFLKALRGGEVALGEAYQIPIARQFTRLVNKHFPSNTLKQADPAGRSFLQKLIRSFKRPGSRDFNDYVVQPTQALFDANDAGRAPIEFLYRGLKKMITKAFKKAFKPTTNIGEAFAKSGGILVDSDWHLGYKIITRSPTPGGQNMVWIQFRPETTYSKPPVIVFASDIQLARYIKSPGNYYLNHWSYSRGGKSLSLSGIFGSTRSIFKGFNRVQQTALGFINISALRNFLSLGSNVVENVYSMSKKEWSKEWVSKFKGSFRRTAINRTFRLFGRAVLGGATGRLFGRKIGSFIGREAQRLGTNLFAPMLRNIAANKKITTGITKASLLTKFSTGALSNLRRGLRATRGNKSVINQLLSVQRKLRQLNRIPNAILPKRPYQGIRFINKL